MLNEFLKVASTAAKAAGKKKAADTIDFVRKVAKHAKPSKPKKCTDKQEAEGKCKRKRK